MCRSSCIYFEPKPLTYHIFGRLASPHINGQAAMDSDKKTNFYGPVCAAINLRAGPCALLHDAAAHTRALFCRGGCWRDHGHCSYARVRDKLCRVSSRSLSALSRRKVSVNSIYWWLSAKMESHARTLIPSYMRATGCLHRVKCASPAPFGLRVTCGSRGEPPGWFVMCVCGWVPRILCKSLLNISLIHILLLQPRTAEA